MSNLLENPWYVLAQLQQADDTGLSFFNDLCAQGLTDDQWRLAQARGFRLKPRENFRLRKNNIKVAFQAEMKRLHGADYACPELPDPHQPIDFYGLAFPEKCDFSGLLIPNGLLLNECHFEAPVDLSGALICGTLNMTNTTFDKKVSAKGVLIEGACDAKWAKFESEALFTEGTFQGPVDFHGARFDGRAIFSKARFAHHVSFRNCHFDQASQGKPVNFINTVFEQPVDFRRAQFGSHYPDFAGATLHDRSQFTAQDCDGDIRFWPGKEAASKQRRGLDRLRYHAKSRESAAVMRQLSGRQGTPDAEHFFFRKEMYHAARAMPWYQAWHILAYQFFSNFGYSVARPASLITLLWAAGTWFYVQSVSFGIGQAMAYSFAAIFKFFGFQRTYLEEEVAQLTGWMEVFAAGQTALAFILLFFLGLGLRTRFRLK
ncbi:pentapeptide repeat-containing protein [Yoonia sp. BS5-3]|uniref:Pentapeptide repeat-containing protein n=1 Tax=Yoonia phaeophyticola TaxID=3137369 RepID=A0ABZ2V236_9RHOB